MVPKKYYYNSKIASAISTQVFDQVNGYFWTVGPDFDNYQAELGQNLINKDKLLSAIHNEAQGMLNIIMMPPMTMYKWHIDKQNIFNLNLYNSVIDKITAFESAHYKFTSCGIDIKDMKPLTPLIKMDLMALQWTAFNAQIPHTTLNTSNEPQYILQYSVKRDQTKMIYNDMVALLENLDPNQYPVYPPDDGTDRPRNPYSPV